MINNFDLIKKILDNYFNKSKSVMRLKFDISHLSQIIENYSMSKMTGDSERILQLTKEIDKDGGCIDYQDPDIFNQYFLIRANEGGYLPKFPEFKTLSMYSTESILYNDRYVYVNPSGITPEIELTGIYPRVFSTLEELIKLPIYEEVKDTITRIMNGFSEFDDCIFSIFQTLDNPNLSKQDIIDYCPELIN